MIVTGAYHDNIIEETNIGDLFIEHNESWHEGMTSSIVCGLEGILKIAPDTDAVLILMCDQPFLSAEILNEMIKTYHHSSKEIVQCQCCLTSLCLLQLVPLKTKMVHAVLLKTILTKLHMCHFRMVGLI